MSNEVVAVRRPDYSITDAEVAIIKTVTQAAPGSWFATDFACECCGNTVVVIDPTADAVVGPRFELSRNRDDRIDLTLGSTARTTAVNSGQLTLLYAPSSQR